MYQKRVSARFSAKGSGSIASARRAWTAGA